MIKKEIIWRELLFQTRENKKNKFTQKEIAEKFNISLSTVFHSLKTLRKSKIVRVTGRFFVLENYRKLLYLWASERNLDKDIYYRGYSTKSTSSLEGVVLPEATFALYSGFKQAYKQAPADYDHLYFYLDPSFLDKAIERMDLREEKNKENVFILKPDDRFSEYSQPLLEQIFVDLWNAPEWYSKDFLKYLEEKILL
jgi:hypothetical protein